MACPVFGDKQKKIKDSVLKRINNECGPNLGNTLRDSFFNHLTENMPKISTKTYTHLLVKIHCLRHR